jgi:hypothetical protein
VPTEGSAATQPTEREPGPTERAMIGDGLARVLRAGRNEATAREPASVEVLVREQQAVEGARGA